MFKWYIVVLAGLAVLLLLGGLLVLIVPEDYEGAEIYRVDEMHAVRLLDLLGGLLLLTGSMASWAAGVVWQRRVDAS